MIRPVTELPWLPGVHLAPNIQDAADIYEIENLAADPEHRLEKATRGRNGIQKFGQLRSSFTG